MKINRIDGIDEKALNDITNILMNSNAVTCSVESYHEPYTLAEASVYIIPSSYRVTVDYNKLAKAVYEAGYRKETKHDPD